MQLVYIINRRANRQRQRLAFAWVGGWLRVKPAPLDAQDRERDDIYLGVAKVEESVDGGASEV